ncbi:MAG: hypothetical protein NZL99_05155 [Burkholderiaceae bacterium]|nr:hypothetical protein [Burkholderiaceae bacterium]
MRVLIASPLREYTGAAWVQADGATVGEVLADLDRAAIRASASA